MGLHMLIDKFKCHVIQVYAAEVESWLHSFGFDAHEYKDVWKLAYS